MVYITGAKVVLPIAAGVVSIFLTSKSLTIMVLANTLDNLTPSRLAQVSIGYGDMMLLRGFAHAKQKNTAATGCAMHSIG